MKMLFHCFIILFFSGTYFFAQPLSAAHQEKRNKGNSEINDDRHDQDEGPGDDRNDHERHKFGKKKKMKLKHVRTFEVNPKVHPLLSMLLQQPPGLIREDRAGALVISGNGPSALVDVIIKTTGGLAGVDTVLSKVYTNAGSIVAGAVQVRNLEALVNFPTVVYVKPAVRMELHLNASVPEIKAEQVRNSSKFGVDGSDVIIGIVDSGIDWRHEDFQMPLGTTKILKLWDQNLTAQPGETPGPAGVGVVYTSADINAALPNNTALVRSMDTLRHGTHVAGIAAGTGLSNAALTGVAPGSPLVIVNTDFSTGKVMDGVEFIFQEAEALGKRAVVNLSLGHDAGAHDGSDEFDQYLEGLLQDPRYADNIVVVSAGNEANKLEHVYVELPLGGFVDVPVTVSGGNAGQFFQAQFWFEDGNGYDELQLITPCGSSPLIPIDSGLMGNCNGVSIVAGGSTANQNLHKYALVNGTYFLPSGPQTYIARFISTGTRSGFFDGWINFSIGMFANFDASLVSPNRTITIPATSRSVISVASYATKIGGSTGTVGARSVFSSIGPIRPHPGNAQYIGNIGVFKPDVAAPGEIILSAVPDDTPPFTDHDTLEGTSMAAPHVTGLAALMMHASPALDSETIKRKIRATARRDGQTGGDPNVPQHDNFFGYGKINALHSVITVRPPSWFISTLPFVGLVNSVAVSPNFRMDRTVFVGTQGGGLWKSTDQGVTWTQIVDGVLSATDTIVQVALQPGFQNGVPGRQMVLITRQHVFLDPTEGDIVISNDGGNPGTWNVSTSGIPPTPPPGPFSTVATAVEFSPQFSSDRTIFIGFSGGLGLYRSTDGGATWGFHSGSFNTTAIKTSPFFSLAGPNREILQAGIPIGLLKSFDGGTSFVSQIAGLPTGGIPFPPAILAIRNTVLLGNLFDTFIGGGAFGGGFGPLPPPSQNIVGFSTTFGEPWATRSLPGPLASRNFTRDLQLSPAFFKDDVIFAAAGEDNQGHAPGQGVFKSLDAGFRWMQENSGFPAIPDLVRLAISPDYPNDGIIYAATASGLWVDPVESSLKGTLPDQLPQNHYKPWDFSTITNLQKSADGFNPQAGEAVTLTCNIDRPADKLYFRVLDDHRNMVWFQEQQDLPAGAVTVTWNGRYEAGQNVVAGEYELEVSTHRWPTFFFPAKTKVEVSYSSVSYASSRVEGEEKEESPPPTPTLTMTPTPTEMIGDELVQNVGAGPNVSDGKKPISVFFTLREPARVTLSIVTLSGEEIFQTAVQGQRGKNHLIWEAKNKARQAVASGLYFYVLRIVSHGEEQVRKGKIVIVR